MSVISMKQLLEAGVHFGHQTERWNPKMAEYIFTERNGIYIIDLQKTVKKIDEAYYFLVDVARNGGTVLFVGTKKQAKDSILEEAERCDQYYVTNRWLGGMFTNFKTIQKRVEKLKQLHEMEEKGIFDRLPKKEVIKLNELRDKLEKNLGGIKGLNKIPSALFVVDPRVEKNAISEARKLGIPVVAIVDTNCDPDEVDYVIPGNDDAIRAVKLISAKMADAILEGRQGVSFAEAEKKLVNENVENIDENIEEASDQGGCTMITADMVKELRGRTQAGMMDCKKALVETNGDMEKAIEFLREKGLATAAKKQGRIASEGIVDSYIHGGGRIGVLVEVNCETDFVAINDTFKSFVRDIAMHIAALSPQFVSKEEVPADLIEKEKAILKAQAINDGKPEHIADKMVEGRISKYYDEVCLLEQPFIKDGDKKVKDIVTEMTATIGEKISIRRFTRYERGEGLQKREENFAEEVAKQIK